MIDLDGASLADKGPLPGTWVGGLSDRHTLGSGEPAGGLAGRNPVNS
jgi:hypothetical protein